jgi:hypothetical protein
MPRKNRRQLTWCEVLLVVHVYLTHNTRHELALTSTRRQLLKYNQILRIAEEGSYSNEVTIHSVMKGNSTDAHGAIALPTSAIDLHLSFLSPGLLLFVT